VGYSRHPPELITEGPQLLTGAAMQNTDFTFNHFSRKERLVFTVTLQEIKIQFPPKPIKIKKKKIKIKTMSSLCPALSRGRAPLKGS
jgi:hypothetical protein